jgi:glycosyltransferase involved in cell wall biosynthesis
MTSSNLRVLQIVTDRERRGGQVFATDLAPALERLGVVVRTVALADGQRPQLEIGVLGNKAKRLSTLRALRRLAKSYDVVVAHGSTTLVACSIGLLGTGVPFVYRQISDPQFWAGTWPRRLRVATYMRTTERVVALSSSTADLVTRQYWLDRKQVVVSPNAVPTGRFFPPTRAERADSRSALGLPDEAPVFAYVGALVAEKGVNIAIEALKAVDRSAVLAIAGNGPEECALKALAAEFGAHRVRFYGALSSPLSIYHAADVVVLPSRGGDSMPASLIEAALCGLPAVTTNVGAITDIVVDNETGLVVPVSDQHAFDTALSKLLGAADLRCRFGQAARARCVQRFTIEAVAPAWVRVLEECSER